MKLKKFLKNYPSLYIYSKENKSAIEDVKSHFPKEYIINVSQVSDIKLNINRKVLIPREETLQIVEIAKNLIQKYEISEITDIGCGSGFIGIMLLKNPLLSSISDLNVTFIDKSKKALEVAKVNIDQLGLTPRSKLVNSNLLDTYLVNESTRVIPQLVLANLPYIPSYKIKSLSKSVRKFEPHLALDGGRDGLVYIKRLINQINELKIPYSIFEIYETHEVPLHKFTKNFSFRNVEFFKDVFGNTRFMAIYND